MLRVCVDNLTICPEIGSPFTWGPSSPGALKVERRKLLFFFALFQNIKNWRKGSASLSSRLFLFLIFFFSNFFFQLFFLLFSHCHSERPAILECRSSTLAPTSLDPPGTRRSLPPFAVDAVSALLRSFFHPTLWNERGCFHSHSCHTLGPFIFDRNPQCPTLRYCVLMGINQEK